MPLLTPLVALAMLQGGWKTIQLGPGIKLQLPANGKRVPSDNENREIKLDLWSGKDRAGNSVTAGFISHPRGTAESFATRPTSFMQQDSFNNARILKQTESLSNGWPEIAYVFIQPGGTIMRSRIRDVKGNLLVMMAGGKDGAESLARLTGSIRLPAAIGKGTAKTAGPAWKRHPIRMTNFSFEFPTPPTNKVVPQPIIPGFESYETSCLYLTQTFGLYYMEMPGLEAGSPDAREKMLERLANSAQTFDPKAKPAVNITAGDRNVWQATAALGDRGLKSARIETFAIGDWAIQMIVIGPASLAKSPAVERFLRSVKVDK